MNRFAFGRLPGVSAAAIAMAAAAFAMTTVASTSMAAAGTAAGAAARATVIDVVQLLRAGGCGGTVPAAHPLNHSALLDQAAARWASGRSLSSATQNSGYRSDGAAGIHLTGPQSSAAQTLARSDCAAVTNRAMRDIGVYGRGMDTWIVLAAPYVVPSRADASTLAARAVELVNAARARGARCGSRWFAPASAVRLSGTLDGVAFGHANDMAEHGYFEHQDRAGRSPADRVRAVGYRENLVGENIAYGPKSADDVVQGWLDSPGHCENIMDPRFAEMGIAYAPGRAVKHGLYWVQVLAAPRG